MASASHLARFDRHGNGSPPPPPALALPATHYGPTFWMGPVPAGYESYGFLPLDRTDATTQSDMRTYAYVAAHGPRADAGACTCDLSPIPK